jgi:hypothetical protein
MNDHELLSPSSLLCPKALQNAHIAVDGKLLHALWRSDGLLADLNSHVCVTELDFVTGELEILVNIRTKSLTKHPGDSP